MKLKSVLCILLLVWPLLLCKGGTVRLLSGENYDAKVSVEGGGITVVRDNSYGNRIEISSILEIVLIKPSGPGAGLYPPGVLLINGTFIPGEVKALISLADPFIKLGKAQTPVSTAFIARVVVKAMPADKVIEPLNGRTGVILPSGEFFFGTYEGIKEKKVAIYSDLLGPQRFVPAPQGTVQAGTQVFSVLVLRDVKSAAARYEIIAKDGTRFQCDDPRFEGESVSIHDTILGAQRIAKGELAVFRAGNGRYQVLSRTRPSSVNAPGGATDVVRIQPGSPTDTDQTQAILTSVNAAVSYPIPAGMSRFSSRIVVPTETAPTLRFYFAIYVDGRLVAKSPLVGSADVPQFLSANINAGRVMTLRVEPAGPVVGTPFGKWIEPMLLRP